jgi:hypothetical protein
MMNKQRAIQEVSLLMVRRKTRLTMFIIGGAALLTLALIAGAVLFALPKTTNAGVATGTASKAPANSSAQTIQTTNTTTDKAAQPAQQPTPAAPTTVPGQVQVPGNPTPANGGNPAPNPTPANNGNPAPNPTTPPAPQNMNMFAQPLKQYGSDIQHMVAQGLNITDKQLATQLQAGKHLKDIAQAQGVSNTQLQNLISNALQSGFTPAVQGGQLTQAQVSSFVAQMQQDPKMLEQELSIMPLVAHHW